MAHSLMVHKLTVWRGTSCDVLEVLQGTSIRDALLENDISPYAKITRRMNCGGSGLCATCGILFEEESPVPKPVHWHDKLAANYGYPRLSCQIIVDRDYEIRLPKKYIWGSRSGKKQP